MSGKRNVTVCRGHELANVLYIDLRLIMFYVINSYKANIVVKKSFAKTFVLYEYATIA